MNIASEVTERDLCISCGTCEQICPHNAISYKFYNGLFIPEIDKDNCTNCGLCTKVCPSYKNDLSNYTKDNIFTGTYRATYSARSNDRDILMNSSSGGIITNIIIKLLSDGYYQNAAVVYYDKFEGQANYTITKDIEVVKKAAKSKYIPVSVKNILEYLKESPSSPLIVVATSCQIYAIKQFCKVKRINIDTILFLGLFCEHTLNYNIFNYYTNIYGDYDKLYFRSKYKNGWPGDTELVIDNKQYIVDRRVRMALKPIFKNNRCRNCFDKLNVQADICFGDHYVKGEGSFNGLSSVIVRTKQGEIAYDSLKGVVTNKVANFSDIAESQHIFGLEKEYARAMLINKNMYKNQPYVSDFKIDVKSEKDEYSLLRIGATAQTYEDFINISKMIRKKPIISRVISRLRIIYNKL